MREDVVKLIVAAVGRTEKRYSASHQKEEKSCRLNVMVVVKDTNMFHSGHFH